MRVLFIIALLLTLNSCKLGRFVVYNKANITDHKIFPNRVIQNGTDVFEFHRSTDSFPIDSLTISYTKKGKRIKSRRSLEDHLIKNKTVAFLVIRNDTILYENYFDDYNKASIVNSFSMAKSFISALIGCAIEDGFINSTQQVITDFIPELKAKKGFDKITIDHLLDMRSGIKFNEGYVNPFGKVASFYYGTNLRKQILRLKVEKEPGTDTDYRSVDTQILGLILERALKNKTISQYLEEKIWKPLQMEYPASWSLDRKKDGLEKAFCCLNARAIDFAKFGRLYLNKGNWEGQQIVPEDWVQESVKVDSTKGNDSYYNNQWWINSDETYSAVGILGQYISVHPKSNIIIVRLGKTYGKDAGWNRMFRAFESKLKIKTKQNID